jgi:hypothetical protein
MGLYAYLSPVEAAPDGGRILQAATADLHAAGRGVVRLIRESISGGIEMWCGRPARRDHGLGAPLRRHGESRRP